ncbi:MAG: L-lactate permease [Desulfosalsimonadaceae bacterium]
MSHFRAWLPYVLIGVILALTRLKFLPFGDWVSRWDLGVSGILGRSGIDYSLRPLYNPGIIPFALVAVLTIFLHRMPAANVRKAWTMVCIHNIVAASSTVGLVGMEGLILRRNAIPLLLYGAVTGLLGLVFSCLLFPGVF